MRKLFMLFVGLIISATVFGQTNVSGSIISNTTWDIAGSPYIVTGSVTIDNGFTLTVDPSVEVRFQSGKAMIVNGTLDATSATFTSDAGSPSNGDWLYIQTGATSSGIVNLTNCNVRYAQYFYVYDGTATLNGTSLEYMQYYGVRNNGTFNMTGGTINLDGYTSSGYGIYAESGSITNLNTVTLINALYGIYVYHQTASIDLIDCNINSNEWPVYYRYLGSITTNSGCVFTGNNRDAFYVYPSSTGSNWTIPTANVPYYFRTNFDVLNGDVFTIGSENIIKFPIYTGLHIYGKLIADAGVGENIFFTSERDDNWGGDTNNDGTSTAPATSNWYGIRFFDSSDDASVMRRCQLRYAGYSSIGGVSFFNAGPTIDYCEFQQNYFGAYIQYASNPIISNTTFGSSSLTPIAMSFEANPTFVDNILSFSDNQYDAIGLIGGTLTANANVIQRDFTTVSNITYVMLSAITVPSGFTLTIAPGIVIKSSTYTYRIIIEGKLVADGTPADWITFTSVKDDNFGNPGDTNKDGTITTPAVGNMSGIIFKNGYDPTSILDYVRTKYTSIYSYYYSNGGSNHYVHACAVATISEIAPVPAGPIISNCEFRESAYGVSCYQASNPVITNNSMVNIINTPFSLAGSADPTYSGNTYTNCGINALGLIGDNVIVNGTISKRTVAGYTNITYVLLENITVVNGTYLDIDPGVVIKMLSKIWYIDGGLKINGTLAEHSIFTSLYDDNVGNPMDTNGDGNATSPAAADWHRLEFRDTSDDLYCELNYTDCQYGGYSSYGVIRTINASPVVNHTLIDQSYTFGIRCDGNSAPSFDNVVIQNCGSDPIAMSLTSNPTFSNITFTANGSNGIFILEGTLSTNASLNKRNVAGFTNIAYIIDALTINSSVTLTLEAGLVLKFRGSYFDGILIHGGLVAIGTSGEKIIFTSFKDDSAGGDTNNDGSGSIPGSSDWDGLVYYPEADDAVNKIIFSEIRYGGGGYGSYFGSGSYHGAVRVKDAYVQIDQSVFQQGTYSAIGIYGSANPAITNCQMNNFTQFPIFMAMFANPTFSGNTIANMGYIAIGIQNETYSQSATVSQRTFAGYTNITYMFYNATINSGTTITIPAGTVFKSTSSYNFTVNGKLEVSGVSGNPCVFTDYRDDDYGNPSDTEQNGSASTPNIYGPGFAFNDVSDDGSFIDYALIRYRNYPVALYSASPTISNNIFYKNYTGISNSGVCEPIITNNTFEDLDFVPLSISLVSYPATTSGNSLSGTTFKGIAVNNETLTQDVTLPVRAFAGISNIPYILGTYSIGTGVTLTIDPGVLIKFTNNGTITVNNGLMAIGTPTSGGNIVFTSITDDFYGGDTNSDGDASAPGSINWNYIFITGQALDAFTQFENCIFRYSWHGNGVIRINNASPSFLYCSFNNCYQGIYATGAANPTINYCDFYNFSTYAVNNVNQSFVIDAENCWWGRNTGPTHAGNPGGTGESVTDAVDYDPYGTTGAINPLAGDVSLNSLIQAYDATLILLYAVDPVTYPLNATQLNVADVSAVGGVTAMDASYILQYVVDLISTFPSEILAPLTNYPSDVKLQIENKDVEPGEIFELPLSISNVYNVFAMQMEINYDPGHLKALDIENLLPGMNMTYQINEVEGIITIAYAGIESIEEDAAIAHIMFEAIENSGQSIQTPVQASFFMANETDLSWNVQNGWVYINGIATGFTENSNEGKDLLFCYPNPFTNELHIEYTIQEDGEHVYIGVYDLYGQQVAEISNGIHQAESYHLFWKGLDNKGRKLNRGTYFLKIIAGDQTNTQKIQLVR